MNAVPGLTAVWLDLKRVGFGVLMLSALGCSAMTPIKGVPVGQYQDDRGNLRSGRETIDLSLLGQSPAPNYLLDSGDVLGVYIDGVLGKREEAPPVYFPQTMEVPPSLGYPIPVREDGTISLPLAGTIPVRGLTITQLEERIRKAYTVDHDFIKAGRDRIVISLQRPRTVNVLVIRQETGSSELGQMSGSVGSLTLGVSKRGTAKLVTLPAYKNDVLHALTETGGLPGLDAENTIYVIRRRGPGGLPQGAFGPTGGCAPGFGAPGEGPGYAPQIGRTENSMQVIDERGAPSIPTQTAGLPIHKMSWQPAAQGTPWSTGRYAAPKWQTANRQPQAPVQHAAAWDAGGDNSQSIAQTAALQDPNPAAPFLDDTQGQQFPPQDQGAMPQGQQYPPQSPRGGRYPQIPMQPNWPQAGMPPQAGQFSQPGQFPPGGPFPPSGPFPQPGVPAQGDFSHILERFGRNSQIIRIPVRLQPGEPLNITEQDITLNDGDIVFIESRETEIFYTGGLLGGGQYILPRDYDLDVLGAISIASGRQATSGGAGWGSRVGGISAMNQDVSVSASDVVVLRQLPGGGQVPINIDLNKALRDPSQRVRIQPGDYVILQYKCHEAVAAFIERNLLAGGVIGLATVNGSSGSGR